jgi:uncharacterized protein YqeY
MQEAMAVLQKEAKKHQDSISQYEQADRADLAKEEKAELDIINDYLPEQMNDADITKVVDEAITEIGANGPADMGKVIGLVRQKTNGQADGAKIAQIAKDKLQ